MRIRKGEYGYIKSQKRVRLIRTIAFFAIALAVFFAGYYINHGDRKNIYTVIAMVGVIPAAMSCVSTIMMWLRPPMDEELHREIEAVSGNLEMMYELFLTTRDKNLYLDAAMVCGGQLLAYTHEERTTADIRFFEQHIEKSLRASGYRREVKIFTVKNKFLSRVSILNDRAPKEEETDYLVRTALLAIAL